MKIHSFDHSTFVHFEEALALERNLGFRCNFNLGERSLFSIVLLVGEEDYPGVVGYWWLHTEVTFVRHWKKFLKFSQGFE